MLLSLWQKTSTFFLTHLTEKKAQLLAFDYARFIWALRSMLASIFSLIIVYFYPDTGIWLISSSAIGMQLFAVGQHDFKRTSIFLGGIFLALMCASLALLTAQAALLYGIVVISVFFAFYISHKGNTYALVGAWSSALIMLNAFFPLHDFLAWKNRLLLLVIGMTIAYILSYLKFHKHYDESLPTSHLALPRLPKKEYLKYAAKGGMIAWLSLVLAHLLHIQNTYWVLFGAITVTKLQTEASLRRSKERVYGTLLGVAISFFLALFLLNWPIGMTIIIPFCIFGAAYYFFYYTIAMVFITLLFVLTFGIMTHHPLHYGLSRLLDTIIGVALALIVSYLWPYREKNS